MMQVVYFIFIFNDIILRYNYIFYRRVECNLNFAYGTTVVYKTVKLLSEDCIKTYNLNKTNLQKYLFNLHIYIRENSNTRRFLAP